MVSDYFLLLVESDSLSSSTPLSTAKKISSVAMDVVFKDKIGESLIEEMTLTRLDIHGCRPHNLAFDCGDKPIRQSIWPS